MKTTGVAAESDRFKFIIKTHINISVGYLLVSVETAIARLIGLTKISYLDIAIISLSVICGTLFFLLFIYLKKSLSPKLEKIVFSGQLVIYVLFFSVWVYRLSDMRFFALFSSLLGILIVLSYTNIIQSLMISVSTILSFIAISYYYIDTVRNGNFIQDIFYALCFIPATIFTSIIANQMTKKNKELEQSKKHLEEINSQLIHLNRELERTQSFTKVELDLAHDIQKSLFPGLSPGTEQLDIALSYKPRYGVSGDFYDFYYENKMLKGLSIFDVSGHGVASALITILAKPVFNNYFNKLKSEPLGRLLDVVNYALRKDLNEINMYITGIILRFLNNEIEYVNAGHPDPLYKNNISRRVMSLSEGELQNKSTPIGIIESAATCASSKIAFNAGDVLLLFTDCLAESINCENNRYGYNRLRKTFEEAPDGTAQEILDHLFKHFTSFVDKRELEDDLTVIVIKKLE